MSLGGIIIIFLAVALFLGANSPLKFILGGLDFKGYLFVMIMAIFLLALMGVV
jgi:hypothetical protein